MVLFWLWRRRTILRNIVLNSVFPKNIQISRRHMLECIVNSYPEKGSHIYFPCKICCAKILFQQCLPHPSLKVRIRFVTPFLAWKKEVLFMNKSTRSVWLYRRGGLSAAWAKCITDVIPTVKWTQKLYPPWACTTFPAVTSQPRISPCS